ncbi:XK-related protein 9 isoform X2 [Ambystoma mexicanum]
MIIVQVFSYTWFKSDNEYDRQGNQDWIIISHLLQFGIFVRYSLVMKYGFHAASFPCCRAREVYCGDIHKAAVDAMTDLSMLRLFETFLESIPQLILQIYILMKYEDISLIQYAFLVAAFCSNSWSAVDFQISLRKSLPEKKGIRVGLPLVTFLFYKILTLTSWTLSIALFGILNIYCLISLIAVLWIMSFSWTWKQKTSFCQSTCMEVLYRVIVGVILVFTFFNVRGQKTKIPMSVYYVFRVFLTASIISLCWYLDPSVTEKAYFFPVCLTIVLALGLGIFSLILYYAVFHPNIYKVEEKGLDTMDGPIGGRINRMQSFLML